jgi:putative oxidoreductase
MKKLLFDCGTREAATSLGLLVLRTGIGLMMLVGHGVAKIGMFAQAKDGWPVPHIWPLSHLPPSVSMIATIAIEVGASALLILGLLTRPAAFLLGFMMVVAAFQVHAGDPYFATKMGEMSKEPALLYLLPAVVLILTGGGLFSLDSQILKEKRRRW